MAGTVTRPSDRKRADAIVRNWPEKSAAEIVAIVIAQERARYIKLVEALGIATETIVKAIIES